MSYPPEFGEEELKWKFERCVNDLVLKTITASLLSFTGAKMFLPNKHLKNAVMASLGVAFGVAWYTCEKEMQLSMRICKDGVDKVIVCEECKKNMEERRKEREKRQKERDERMKRIQREMEGVASEEIPA